MRGRRDHDELDAGVATGPPPRARGDVTDAVAVAVDEQRRHRQPVARLGAQGVRDERRQHADGRGLGHRRRGLPDVPARVAVPGGGAAGGVQEEPARVPGERAQGGERRHLLGGETDHAVARRVGHHQGVDPLGVAAHDLLRDVAAQAQADQRQRVRCQRVEQRQHVVDGVVEAEGTRRRRRPVVAQVHRDHAVAVAQDTDLRSPRVMVEGRAVQQEHRRRGGGPSTQYDTVASGRSRVRAVMSRPPSTPCGLRVRAATGGPSRPVAAIDTVTRGPAPVKPPAPCDRRSSRQRHPLPHADVAGHGPAPRGGGHGGGADHVGHRRLSTTSRSRGISVVPGSGARRQQVLQPTDAAQLLPPQPDAAGGRDHRPDQHRVHQLPVDDLLQRQEPEHAQRLALEPEGDHRGDELDRLHRRPRDQRRHRVEEQQPVDQEDVHQRREQRQQHLEHREVPQAGPAEAAGRAGLEHRAAVLPHRLHRPVAPAVALAPQLAQGRGRLGPGPRGLLVDHAPAAAADRHGEVGVLGERVVADPADLQQHRAPERADGARDGRHAAQDVVDAAVDVEAHDVLDVLPARDQPASAARPWRCRPPRRPTGPRTAGRAARPSPARTPCRRRS